LISDNQNIYIVLDSIESIGGRMEDLMVLQNPWWRGRDEIYKDDKVKAVLSKKSPLKYFFEKKNKVIIGPRQVGKTTYLKLCI